MARYICIQCPKRCRVKLDDHARWDDDIPKIERPAKCPPENEPKWLRVV